MDEQTTTPEGAEAAEAPEVDYKAKYEEAVRHSREWERKAKANKGAADELEQLKASQLTEAERLQRERDRYKAQVEELTAQQERAGWVSELAAETGVPAEVLSMVAADSRDELAERARAIAGRLAERPQQPQTVPVVIGDGKRAEGQEGPHGDFLREQFKRIMR